MTQLVSVILCGGAGSRLWPVSRELHPKPFITLPDGQSLLQKAFLRASTLSGVQEVLTITNRDIFFQVEDALREMASASTLTTSFILEPVARNTAAAVAVAALYVAEKIGKDVPMLVMPADHLIALANPFQQAVTKAMAMALRGQIVTFGVQPTSPETGYGYIEAEEEKVLRFVEKPALAQAEEYVASGKFLWNAGIFCFTPEVILQEMAHACPAILDAVQQCFHASARQIKNQRVTQIDLDEYLFSLTPSESIDYAVMEKSDKMAVVACDIGWRDIGSWREMSHLTAADSDGNSLHGKALLYDVQDCYIQSAERIVAAVGIQNLMVIDTSDAVLIAHRDRAQDVRHLYSQLKSEGHEAYKLHRTVHRPWGTYTILGEGAGFKIKRIEVKPKASLSLQVHQHRSEHWVVVSGKAKVVNGEQTYFVEAGQSTYIPATNPHRLTNPEDVTLVIIEVQNGAYLGEDDIVRLDDIYGRT